MHDQFIGVDGCKGYMGMAKAYRLIVSTASIHLVLSVLCLLCPLQRLDESLGLKGWLCLGCRRFPGLDR